MHLLENSARYLRHAMRQLTRSSGFAFLAVTLALGIGANPVYGIKMIDEVIAKSLESRNLPIMLLGAFLHSL